MKDAHDANAERDQATRYLRLPWPVVAAGLVALLAVVFGVGLYANRNLRPQVGLVPTSEPALVAAPPATPTPQVATAAPTPAPAVVVQATAAAIATLPAPIAAPTAPPLVVASPTPSALPTVEPALG